MTDGKGRVDLSIFFGLTLVQLPERFTRIVRGRRGRSRRFFVDFDVVNFGVFDFAAIRARITYLTRNGRLCWMCPRNQRLFR